MWWLYSPGGRDDQKDGKQGEVCVIVVIIMKLLLFEYGQLWAGLGGGRASLSADLTTANGMKCQICVTLAKCIWSLYVWKIGGSASCLRQEESKMRERERQTERLFQIEESN